MKRRREGSSKDSGKLNLTAMIDVVFNLLIFFMCSPFKVIEGELDAFLPPEGPAGPPEHVVERIVIRLQDTGDLPTILYGNNRLGIVGAGDERTLDFNFLAHWLKKMGEPVEIASDSSVEYQYVVGVLNACTKAGVEEISFRLPTGGTGP